MSSKIIGYLKNNYVYLFLALSIMVFYMWRVQYGYACADEQGILVFSYNFARGDRPIIDNWNMANLFAVLMTPISYIYKCVNGDGEGIVLFVRQIFAVVQALIAYYIMVTFKRYSPYVAVAMGLMFALYTPFGINTIMYNIAGLWMVVLLSLIFENKNDNQLAIPYILYGVLIAGLVLCNPACIVLYLFQIAYWIYCWKYKKNIRFMQLIQVHVGIMLIACLFVILICKGGSPIEFLRELKHNLPHLLSDGTHSRKSMYEYIKPVFGFFAFWPFCPIVYLILIAVGIIIKPSRKIVMAGLMVNTLVYYVYLLFNINVFGINVIMLPMAIMGIPAYFWFRIETCRSSFFSGYLLSLTYAIILIFTSNNGVLIFAHGCTWAAVISCVFTYGYILSFDTSRRVFKNVANILFIAILCTMLFKLGTSRINDNFWEASTFSLTERLSKGGQKGIYTTKERKDLYEIQISEIQNINTNESENILIFCEQLDGYFITNARTGSFSPYCYEEPGIDTARFNDFYLIHEDRIPDYIYIDSQSKYKQSEEYWKQYALNHVYNYQDMPSGSILMTK